jgi:UDP-N-acetylmuramoyl-tripeptide--D-alanyl-D-alanine ligase
VENVLDTLQKLARYHRDQFRFTVLGLTGSNGKTTNKELIHAVLSRKYKTFATQGNLNNHIGVPLTLLSIPLTAEMAVIEMGANAQGEIRDLSNICDPDFGMITNIGKAHLEGFGGIEGVKKGKSELYKHIGKKAGKIFINADDPVLMDLGSGLEQIRFGSKPDYFIHGQIERSKPFLSFSFSFKGKSSGEIQTRLVGDYNFSNFMAAACIGCYFGVDINDICEALSSYQPQNNRSQFISTGKNKIILDAYNANPSSMNLAVANFASMDESPKIALIGHMLELGEDTQKEHQALIDLLVKLNLQAVLVGSNFANCNKKGLHYCETPEELHSWLSTHPIRDYLVFIKGSRLIAMEKAQSYL